MNVLPLSDLHLEWHRDFGVSFIESLDPTGVDVLVLAGDISDAKDAKDILGMLCEKFPEVVYVHGNHELYGHSPEQAKGYIHRAKPRNLHWLNSSAATINGVRFMGTTLWFPRPPPRAFKGAYNDFAQIRGFEPWVYDEHRAALAFLRTVQPGDVLVTHFIPLRESIHEMYRDNPLNCFFYAGEEADEVVRASGAQLVVHGHTHCSFDYQLPSGTRVVCNPFGYMRVGQNVSFDERLIVGVESRA